MASMPLLSKPSICPAKASAFCWSIVSVVMTSPPLLRLFRSSRFVDAILKVRGPHEYDCHHPVSVSVAQKGRIGQGDDVLDVLRAPAGVGQGQVALAEPRVDLQILLFEV